MVPISLSLVVIAAIAAKVILVLQQADFDHEIKAKRHLDLLEMEAQLAGIKADIEDLQTKTDKISAKVGFR